MTHFDRLDVMPSLGAFAGCHVVRCHCWVLGAIPAAIAGCNRRGVVLTHFDRLDVVPLLGAMVRCHCALCGAIAIGAMVRCHCWMPWWVPLLDAVCCSCCGPKKCYPSVRSSCILSLTRLMVVVRTTKSYSLCCFWSLGLLCPALHAFTSAVICAALRCGRL